MDGAFPEGIEAMPPGGELGLLLEAWLPRQAGLPSAQAVALKKASWRQRNHQIAMDEASMHEIACRRPGQAPRHAVKPTRAGIAEVAQLHGWSDGTAKHRVQKAHEAIVRLPMLHSAQVAGEMDDEVARAYARATQDMPDQLAGHVVAHVMADSCAVTKDAVADGCMRAAIEADPDVMDEILAKALARAHVTGGRQRDGSAFVTGRNLRVADAADILGNARYWAERAVRDGDPRPYGVLEAIALTGFASGAWRMHTDAEILAHYRTTRPAPGDPPGDDTGRPAPDPEGGPDGPDDADGPTLGEPEADDAVGDETVDDEPVDETVGDGPDPGPFASRKPQPPPGHGIGLQVELSTLLGRDRHPGALARWGSVDADLARALACRHSSGQWTFVLVDDEGYFITSGLIRARPTAWPTRHTGDRSHVDLLVPLNLLADLVATGQVVPAWAKVVDDIVTGSAAAFARPAPDPTRRFADARTRRHVLTRSPMCIWRYCRRPSRAGEVDHAREHSRKGPTLQHNLWPHCKPHHALKSRFGWDTVITGPTTYDLISHLGTVHKVVLPPTLRPHAPPCRRWRHVLPGLRDAG